jgi:glucosylglycerate phosphorylase
MSEIIHEYLSRLYTPEQARSTYRRLQEIMERRSENLPEVSGDEPFSERDVILITYGDSLRRPGEMPLQTLHRFARDRLSGVISAVHILPFFPYSSDDGFSVQDFYTVDPALGDWDDIERLGGDFDLMFDAVFNHMSAQSDWFRAFLAGDPLYAGLFRTEAPDADLSAVVRPRTHPLLTPFTRPDGSTVHVWTTFSADQVDFDLRSPDSLLRLVDILLFYVERRARIIRLDAIAYLWKEVGTDCIHLEETHIVIRLMRAVLDVVAPGVLLITETNVPHDENISYFGDGYNEAQMVYNFTLPPLLFHTMLSGKVDKLRAWANTLATPSERTAFFNFTASHDGIGVRPVEGILTGDELQALIDHTEARGGRVSYRHNSDGTRSPYELNISYVDAMAGPEEPVDMQVKRFMVSQAIALTLAGVPAIYIHSLLGSHNNIEGMLATGHNRTINRARLDYDGIEQALRDRETFRAQVFAMYTDLIRCRTGHKAFHPGAEQQALDVGSGAVFALLRTPAGGGERILGLFNVTNQPQTVDLRACVQGSATDLISGVVLADQPTLAPYQVCWLRCP